MPSPILRPLSIALVLLIATVVASAQSPVLETYGLLEIPLQSDSLYAHPHRDVRIWCDFIAPDGSTVTHAGYWNGGRDYRVRFAPSIAGKWRYRTWSSDIANAGLHGREGEFTVNPYAGDDPFRAHGWPRVSDNSRYLTYADGEPFFYLGDTAWEIVWKSRLEQMKEYMADRRSKEFTAVQIVTMSHQKFESNGVVNRYGEPYLLDGDRSMLNPRYFDYLDSIVVTANASGMIAVLVPMWAAMTYANHNPYYKEFFSHDEALSVARYIGARYGGYNVMWIVGGDNAYDTPQRREFWSEFAHTLRAASGGSHLTTTHPHAWGASFDYYSNHTDWLDLHMYQSSHIAGGIFTHAAAIRGWRLPFPKPILNGEACYEDIYHNLWTPGDTSHPQTFRIRPEHVRQASYESILSGSQVGITYGGNGIWQWHTPEIPGSHQPRLYVEDAWNMPASSHMSVLKRLMTEYKWYTCPPRPELIFYPTLNEGTFIPAAGDSTCILMYIPQNTDSVRVYLGELGSRVDIQWVSPITGDVQYTDRVIRGERLGAFWIFPRDTSDWFVVISLPSAHPSRIEAYGLLEIPLQSSRQYDHPLRDVRIWCDFTAPDGTTFRQEGFWDGGKAYAVRFAPTDTGTWRYRVTCSDTNNRGLHNRRGEVQVDPYSGSDPYRSKGWVKVSENKRYLTYNNGDPFFYLGDTVWEIVWRSTFSQVRDYIADRKTKEFNVIQLVVGSHIYMPEQGIRNRNGETLFIDSDWSMINPEYFRYLDSLVTMANDSGIMVSIVPVWGGTNELYSDSPFHLRYLTLEEAMMIKRYVAARYAGHNVLWIVTGDEVYDTPERKDFYNSAAYAIRAAGGPNHLMTIHTAGWQGSYSHFGEENDWLDFHAYQPSHAMGGDYAWAGPLMDYLRLDTSRPLLNIESNYEDLYHLIVSEPTPVVPKPFRLTPIDIREAQYESLLSGARVGMVYGANGLFQWAIPGMMDVGAPRYTFDVAMHLPGSSQMAVLKKLMTELKWYQLDPHPELRVGELFARESFLPIASDSSKIVIYAPPHTDSAQVDLTRLGDAVSVKWIDPSTAQVKLVDSLVSPNCLKRYSIIPLDTNDWLVVATRITVSDSLSDTPPDDSTDTPRDTICPFHITGPMPNPCLGRTTLRYELPSNGTLNVSWWDVLGRRIGGEVLRVNRGIRDYIIADLVAGVYQVRVLYTTDDGEREQWEGRVVSLE